MLLAGMASAEQPNKRMLDDDLRFTGPEGQTAEAADLEAIVIGLFAPLDDDSIGRAMLEGASLACEQANAAGGFESLPFRIVQRWADDPWGAGSKEVIRLVYEDHAWALIGGADGASTHVAQQIATKSHLVLVAPVSSDPSLTHTRVPWIFRLPPDDEAQARVLVEGVVARGLRRVGLVSGTDRDSRTAAAEIVKAMQAGGVAPVFHLEIDPAVEQARSLAERVAGFDADAVVVRLPPAGLVRLLDGLRAAGVESPVFIPWIPGPTLGKIENLFVLESFTPGPAHTLFESVFRRRFERAPPPEAAYAYDAANLVIEAIRRGGLSRRQIQAELAGFNGYAGVTGAIRWDTGGGNHGKPVMRGPDTP